MTEKEMKLLHERMKKEDPRLLALMEKCFDAGVMSGKEQAQRTWVGLTDGEWMNIVNKDHAWYGQRPDEVAHEVAKLVEAKLKEKNT